MVWNERRADGFYPNMTNLMQDREGYFIEASHASEVKWQVIAYVNGQLVARAAFEAIVKLFTISSLDVFVRIGQYDDNDGLDVIQTERCF